METQAGLSGSVETIPVGLRPGIIHSGDNLEYTFQRNFLRPSLADSRCRNDRYRPGVALLQPDPQPAPAGSRITAKGRCSLPSRYQISHVMTPVAGLRSTKAGVWRSRIVQQGDLGSYSTPAAAEPGFGDSE